MTALVTGGSGFVGRYLVAALLAGGRRVRCLVRSSVAAQAVERLGAEAVPGDLTDPPSLGGVADGVSEIYHLAALGHVAAVSEESYRRFWAVNVEGTRSLFAVASGRPLQKVVHFSSITAMGAPQAAAMDEETPCRAVTPYERSKRESELAALAAWRERGTPAVIVRPCMVYGPGGQGEFLKICRLVARGVFPRVSRGSEWAAAVHVRDLVAGALLAAERGRPGEAYLLAGPASFEMHELRRLILAALDLRRPYPYIPLPMALAGARLFEAWGRLTGQPPLISRSNIVATACGRIYSIGKAQRELGYQPRVPLAEGVAETVAWYRREGLL